MEGDGCVHVAGVLHTMQPHSVWRTGESGWDHHHQIQGILLWSWIYSKRIALTPEIVLCLLSTLTVNQTSQRTTILHQSIVGQT